MYIHDYSLNTYIGSHGKYIIFSLCPLSRWTCAFTVYICTISFFPVHLKLDFLIFFFLCIQPAHSHFRGMAFIPSMFQIVLFDFFYRAFSLHICLFTRQAFSPIVCLKLYFFDFFYRAFSLHICLFTRQAFSPLGRPKSNFSIFFIVHFLCIYAFFATGIF